MYKHLMQQKVQQKLQQKVGSAKLRATRALMAYVRGTLRALVPHVPRALRDLALLIPHLLQVF